MGRSRLATAIVVSILVGGATLAAVVAWLGADDLRALTTIRLPWLAGAAALLAASWTLAGVRLRMLIGRAGYRLPVHRTVRAHLLGLFASAVTPGGSGGMPAVALAISRHGVPTPAAWASAVAASAGDMLHFGLTLPVALAVLGSAGALPASPWIRGASVAIAVAALAVALLLTVRLRWAKKLAHVVLIGRLRRFRERVDRFVDELTTAQSAMRRASPAWHLAFHAAVTASWWCMFAVLWAAARGFGIDASLPTVLAALTLVAGVGSVVPTPGGSGFFEAGASLALVSQGARSGVVSAVVVWRLLTHYAVFVVGPPLGGYLLAREPDAADDPG